MSQNSAVVLAPFVRLRVDPESMLASRLGAFDKFCLECVREQASNDDITDIIQLPRSVVDEQLKYLVGHGFLTTDFELTDLAQTYFRHKQIIDAFEDSPLYLLVDALNANVVVPAQLYPNLLSRSEKGIHIRYRISPENFTLTPKYQDKLDSKALEFLKLLQPVSFESDTDPPPFAFTYRDATLTYLQISLESDILNNEQIDEGCVELQIPAWIEQLEVIFPELLLLQKDVLSWIRSISSLPHIETSTQAQRSVLDLLIKARLVTPDGSSYELTEAGAKIQSALRADAYLRHLGPVTCCREQLFHSILPANRLVGKNGPRQFDQTEISQEFLKRDWSKAIAGFGAFPSDYGRSHLPSDALFPYVFHSHALQYGFVQCSVPEEQIWTKISEIARRRILWGTGWKCAACGFEQSSSQWNADILSDHYPASTRAFYRCRSCRNEVELKAEIGKSGIVFAKRDGPFISSLVES